MKKRIISLFVVVAILLAMVPQLTVTAEAASSGRCGENVYWNLDDNGTLYISGTGKMYDYNAGNNRPEYYSFQRSITKIVIEPGVTRIGATAFSSYGRVSQVSIPASVIEIGTNAFHNCLHLCNITLPNGVEAIGDNAFGFCKRLEWIVLPDSVKTIGKGAFYGCSNLRKIEIPKNVEYIGSGAFARCDNLFEIYAVEENNAYNSDSDGVLYNEDWSTLVAAPGALSGSYTVPNGVRCIGRGAFFGCQKLEAIFLPNSLISISPEAFMYCGGLSYIVLPNGLEEIGAGSFADCTNIESIIIPSSVVYIDYLAFYGCMNLKEIIFQGNAPTFSKDANSKGQCLSYINATVYYPAGNSTWTEEIREDHSGGALTWVAIDMPNYYGFWLNKDGWCFANAAESFAREPVNHADDYYIPRERYDEVFGSAYVDATKGLYTEEWRGNCAGMSTTVILFFLNKLDWLRIGVDHSEGIYNPNDFYCTIIQESGYYYPAIGNEEDITRLIEAYQLYINAIDRSRLVENLVNTYYASEAEIRTLYSVTDDNEPIVTQSYVYKHIPRDEGGTYIDSMLKKFQEACDKNVPLYISLKGHNFGHAIVLRTDKKPEEMGDGWWRVYVYDPNKPYINESVTSPVGGDKHAFGCNTLIDNGGDIYIELNPDLNQWRYCTSVNSNSPDNYIGSTESGTLLWNGVYRNNENNEQYHIQKPDYFYAIDLTSFTMEDYTNPCFESLNAWIPENELAVAVDGSSNFAVYSASGELVAVVENGEGIVLNGSGYYVGYIGGTEASSPAGGKLYLPNDVYTVEYTSGQIVVLGCNNAISITGDAPMEFTVDVVKNSVQILAASDGTVSIRCANVISPDECSYVETEGILLAGETLSIAYPDNNKVQAATDSKDGQFQLYQKNADQEESVATSVIKSGSLDWRWIVVGVAAAGVVLFILIRKKKSNA